MAVIMMMVVMIVAVIVAMMVMVVVVVMIVVVVLMAMMQVAVILAFYRLQQLLPRDLAIRGRRLAHYIVNDLVFENRPPEFGQSGRVFS